MALEREVKVSAVAIGDISLEVFSPIPGSSEQGSVVGSFQVRRSDGEIRVRRVNLWPELLQAEKDFLQTMMTRLRNKGNSEILPLPDNPVVGGQSR